MCVVARAAFMATGPCPASRDRRVFFLFSISGLNFRLHPRPLNKQAKTKKSKKQQQETQEPTAMRKQRPVKIIK